MKINFTNTSLILLLLSAVFSCVPKKDLIYLQQGKRQASSLNEVVLNDFNYRLQPGDEVFLRVFSLTSSEYNFFNGGGGEDGGNVAAPLQFKIDEEGNIELPVAEKIKIGGRTIEESRLAIQELLGNYLQNPVVQLEVNKVFEFTVIGESGAGNYMLPTYQVSILEALAAAGGLTEFADGRKIKVVRQEGDKKTIHLVNVLDENLLRSKDYYIRPRDIIIVDTKRDKPTQSALLAIIGPILGSVGLLFAIFRQLDRN